MRKQLVLIVAVLLLLSGCKQTPAVTNPGQLITTQNNPSYTTQPVISTRPITSMPVSSVIPPIISTQPASVFFSYCGTGITGSPPFESNWSYWMITYTTDWDGLFTLELKTGKTGHIVVDQPVKAGEVYQSCVIGYTGSPFFVALHAPDNGNWTVQVEPDPDYS